MRSMLTSGHTVTNVLRMEKTGTRNVGSHAAVIANIRALLATRGISRAALAHSLGWSESGLYRRLTNRTTLTLDELDELSSALNVPVSGLLDPTAAGR